MINVATITKPRATSHPFFGTYNNIQKRMDAIADLFSSSYHLRRSHHETGHHLAKLTMVSMVTSDRFENSDMIETQSTDRTDRT